MSDSRLPDGLRRPAEAFVDYLTVERGASPRTVEAYRRELYRYLRHLASDGIRTPSQARPADVASALQARSDAGAAASTLHRSLAAIRHFHRFCVRDGLAGSDPAALVDGPRRGMSIPKALKVDEVVRILEAASGTQPAELRDRAMLELLYAAGLRVSELVGLDVDDVDLEDRSVRCLGKGERERVVPIGGPAADAVRRYAAEGRPALLSRTVKGTPALFVSARGARLSRQSAWSTVRRYAAKALGGRKVHPHVLRHSFATHLLQGGADVRVVQEALGHARLSTTQVYTLVSRDTLKAVIESAHPRGRTRPRPADANGGHG